ncbi:DUF5625 family protein [Propionivibrio dicarboxylicus]|uniref:DUF5625 domain-containing protein n=1 Tax=Propionivibrio dicarboxylicus TaxID=83767 RepID=A0A1G8JI88_9RHOO|nr:DUF5625 family protein [Propionivibrio dicarboxylicus]SDI30360.1 hypothetical protein SAMN05660652_03205 [Propionivibrio dicarboxylicus]
MMSRRRFLSVLGVLPWMTVLAADKPLELPFFVPFPGMGKAGAKLSVDFVCPKRYRPWYALLAPKPVDDGDPRQDWMMYLAFLFISGDIDDGRRVKKIAGSPRGDIGVPVSLKIKITARESSDARPVYEKSIENEPVVVAAGNGRIHRIVDGVLLLPGKYRLEVESVDDIPALVLENIEFAISYPRGK